MPKFSGFLSKISLKEILTTIEIEELKKYQQFKSSQDKTYNYEKNELILKLISLAIDKFNQEKENALVKCFKWAKKIIQKNLEIKIDSSTLKDLENMKKSKPSLKVGLGWVEEFSLLTKEEEIYKLTKKNFEKYKEGNDNKNKIKNINLKNSTKKLEIFKSRQINKINEDLLDFESHQFNIFKLEDKVGKENILPVVTTYIFSTLDLFSIIDYTKFEPFIFRIASGYHRENPYHNDLHAADVCQSLLVYYLCGKLQTILDFNYLDLVSLFISGAIHDYGHPGYTNNFLINTRNEIAIRYNDQSVLENYHISESFQILLNKENCNIFSSLSLDDYKYCRKRIIQCVLATDMTTHNRALQNLKSKAQLYQIQKGENLEKLFEDKDPVINFNTRQEFLNILIHAADISNPTRPLDIYKIWAEKCVIEFFRQGDMEKELGLPISFNCDRNKVSFPQSQIGFIDAIVNPLFSIITEFFPGINFTLQNLKKNKEYYITIKEKEDLIKIKGKEKDDKINKNKKETKSKNDNNNNNKSIK